MEIIDWQEHEKNGFGWKIGISSSTLAKMSKGEAVSITIMEKICEELNCDFGDIINYERKGEGQDGV